jgi:hypothetical protein
MAAPAARVPAEPPIPLDPDELRAVVQLVVQAVEGVTGIVEGVHQSVWSTLGFPGGRGTTTTRGATGLVYAGIRGITRGVGYGLDAALAGLSPWLQRLARAPQESAAREAMIAALNGVIGDRLAATDSPLAIRMGLRHAGRSLSGPEAAALATDTRRVVLLLHGLCMHDGQWRAGEGVGRSDLGARLAAELGYVPLHLRYNSGRRIADNGDELSHLLEASFARTGGMPASLDVVAHSMGGLVIRAALAAAVRRGHAWPTRMRRIVFLGTPHHGAPLERAGHGVDRLLAATRYTAPFARLGLLRSAGITDLRHGHFGARDGDDPEAVASFAPPLPPGIACHTIAATTAARRSALADRLTGDGLVPLRSALGQHQDPARTLHFAPESQWIAYRTSHLGLLHDEAVASKVLEWLAPEPRSAD